MRKSAAKKGFYLCIGLLVLFLGMWIVKKEQKVQLKALQQSYSVGVLEIEAEWKISERHLKFLLQSQRGEVRYFTGMDFALEKCEAGKWTEVRPKHEFLDYDSGLFLQNATRSNFKLHRYGKAGLNRGKYRIRKKVILTDFVTRDENGVIHSFGESDVYCYFEVK